jgi:hypothetical protein
MYCGSCFRDNALAAELMARGHDVTLVPIYTPTRTDEPNVSRHRVLFGGISVYLQQHSALFRRTPRFLDRLWDSPGVIRAFASRAVSTDARLLGDMTISMLQGTEGVLRKEFDKLVEWVRSEPLPDVVNLPNSLLVAMAAPLKDALKRPVCCTLQGEELFLNGLAAPYREQAIALIRRHSRSVDRAREPLLCDVHVSCWTSRPTHRRRPLESAWMVTCGGRTGTCVLCQVLACGSGEGVACWPTRHPFPPSCAPAPARLEAARYWPGAFGVSGDVRRTLQRRAADEFHYRGAVDRAGKRVSGRSRRAVRARDLR